MPASTKKPVVVVTRKLPEVVENRMRELFDARLNADDKPMTQAQLVEAAKSADVLVPTVTDRIDRGVISQASTTSTSTPHVTARSPSRTRRAC